MSQQPEHAKLSQFKQLALAEVAALQHQFMVTANGLSNRQAKKILLRDGPNTILTSQAESPLIKFIKLFFSPLSFLLLTLSTVSYLTGEPRGALVILLIVLLSSLITAIQEHKSNNAANKLKNMVSCKTTVVRSGKQQEVELSDVVVGDNVILNAGAIIPADLRLIEVKDLFVNQSALSGESLPSEKFITMRDTQKVGSVFDYNNICFMGTHVVSGTGQGVVIATGSDTFFGDVARQTISNKKMSSFDLGIKKFAMLMIRFMLVMAPLVFLLNGFLKGNWVEAGLFAIALSIGLAPEMLPMLVTVNLAKGAIAMAKRKVIVKKLNAIQNMGAMDILCTDKTGTLTQDQIILEKYLDVNGKKNQRVLEFAYLNSHYQSGLKNPLDEAILQYTDVHNKLHKADDYKKVDEIPFDFERRRMSVVVQKGNKSQILICKGAVEEIIHCCRYVQIDNQSVAIAPDQKQQLLTIVRELNQDGFRVVAVAIKEMNISPHTYTIEDENDLLLVGYVAFLDPPKESAKYAIEQLNQLGVSVKILTGDNEYVTRKICHEVGLQVEQIILGAQIEEMSDSDLKQIVEQVVVFAKMTPQQKARVILALQSKGHVVGYMGDGINDGPSLKLADVSISVDTAVDIAKETADIILLEKNLMILRDGVLEGRRVFCNIMKYLKMSASSTFGNVLSMVGASVILPFLPMLPEQVLLNDLLYDFSQTSVPSDNVDAEYLEKPRAWDISGIGHYMLAIGPISSLFDYLTFAFLWFVLKANTPENSQLFQTGWFVESLLSQTMIVHVIRTGKIPFLQSKPSRALILTTLLICALGAILPYTVLASGVDMTPLPAIYWYGLAVIILAYMMTTQVIKMILVKRFGLI